MKKRIPLKKFLITHRQGDKGYDIGGIAVPKGISVSQAKESIRSAWTEFQASCPDCDDEFIEWLIQNHGFKTTVSASETFEV